jgi:hypothetical protein
LAAIDLSQRKRGPSWEKNGAILTFDTGDSQTGGGQLPQMGKMGRQSLLLTLVMRERVAGQLPQDFAKFFSSSCPLTFCSAGDADEVKR